MSRLARHFEMFENVERESDLLSGSKLKMIQTLFEGLCASLLAAQGHDANHALERKMHALLRAQRILKGLQSTLKQESEGSLVSKLAPLYGYMAERLWRANIRDDSDALNEVLSLTRTLADGWQTLTLPATMRFDRVGQPPAKNPGQGFSFLA
jgi:flagellar protein FliS